MGVVRVDDQRHAHGLEAAPGQLGAMGAGRGRQVVAEHVGEVHAALFDQRAVTDHPRAPTAAGRALPGVLDEARAAVFGLQGGTDTILQIEQVGFDGIERDTHEPSTLA